MKKSTFVGICLLLSLFFFGFQNNLLAQVQAGEDQDICAGGDATLTATNGDNYVWEAFPPDPSLTNPNATTITVSPDVNTMYVLTSRVVHENLVVNGDFEAGNFGFNSEYVHSPGYNGLWDEGTYAIVTDANTVHTGFHCSNDHTTGFGKMMCINGATTLNETVWTQTINNLEPDSDYDFSTYISSLSGANTARLKFSINGFQQGNVISASTTTCRWDEFYTIWESGSATSVTISIENINTIGNGNDFSLDDINFSPVTFSKDTVWVFVHDNPTSTFTVNPDEICSDANTAITYTGTATPTGNYDWDFDGGQVVSGTGIGPYEVSWDVSGDKNITLQVEEYGCSSGTNAETVTVNKAPAVSLSADATSIPFGTTTTLHSTASGNPGPVTFIWEPADQLVDATLASPTTIGLEASTIFTFIAHDETSGCETRETIEIEVTGGELAIVDVTASNPAICLNTSTTITVQASGGSGSYTANWSATPPDPSLSGNDLTLSVSPLVPTTYAVILDDGFNQAGPVEIPIDVLPLPVVVTHPEDRQAAAGQTTGFSCVADNVNAYQWEVSADNGTTWQALQEQAPYSGTQTDQLSINPVQMSQDLNQYRCVCSGDCEPAVTTQNALLNVFDDAGFSARFSESSICLGEDVSGVISVMNATDLADFHLKISWDTQHLELVTQQVNPVFSGAVVNLTTDFIEVDWSGNLSVSQEETVMFLTFTSLDADNPVELSFVSNECVLHDSFGQELPAIYSDAQLEIRPLCGDAGPIDGMAAVCEGSANYIYSVDPVADAESYNWTLPVGWSITGGDKTEAIEVAVAIDASDGLVEVTPENSCGTGGAMQLDAVVKPLPIPADSAIVDKDYLHIYDEADIELTAIGGWGDEIMWWENSCDSLLSPFATEAEIVRPQPVQTTTYYVAWRTACGVSECRSVRVEIDPEIRMFVPTGFTPNNDGNNDLFRVQLPVDVIADFQMKVYTKWGQLVYENADPLSGWDGTIGGNPAPAETYVWVIDYRSTLGVGGSYSRKGIVTLVY